MGLSLGLPELEPDEYMVQVMFDLKPTRQNGENVVATDWDVIGPYGAAIGLEPDDMVLLSKMCRGYHQEWLQGENPLAIEPVERG